MLENVIKKLFPIRDEQGRPCTFPTFASQVFFDDGTALEYSGYRTKKYSLYFPASGWTEQQDGSFTQQATAEGMLASDSAIVDVDMTGATVDTFGDMSDAWSAVSRAQTQDGSLLLTAFDGAPEIDLTVKVEVFR